MATHLWFAILLTIVTDAPQDGSIFQDVEMIGSFETEAACESAVEHNRGVITRAGKGNLAVFADCQLLPLSGGF